MNDYLADKMFRLKYGFIFSCVVGTALYIVLSTQRTSERCSGIDVSELTTSSKYGCNRREDSTQGERSSSMNISCKKNNPNIVYIKVHKAASSTMNQILLRYGLNKNKILALPKWGHYFDFNKPFHRTMALGYDKRRGNSELLINHARLNRPEMDAVVEDAIYLASLREPAAQFESTFGFFKLGNYFKNNKDSCHSNPLEIFMSNPNCYSSRFSFRDGSLRNQQIFDLGLDPKYFDDICAVENKIEELDKNLDLVLISEYLDESLIVMKYLLGLEFKDILYIPANVRSNKYRNEMSKNVSSMINSWNSADMQLYKHFNKTLWRLIDQHGEQFTNDLQIFLELKQKTTEECIEYTNFDVDQRLWKIRLREDASEFCKNLTRNTVPTIKHMRSKVISEYGTMLDKIVDKTIIWVENMVKQWKIV